MAAEQNSPAVAVEGGEPSPASQALTVLRCGHRHIAAKRFLADGSVQSYDAGNRFTLE